MKRLSLGVAIVLAALGCSKDTPTAPGTLPFERITPTYGRQYTGLKDPLRLAIRDARTFDLVWSAAYRNFSPAPPTPAVDFEKEMVIVVAMGERASGGFAIDVTGAEFRSGRPVVAVRSGSARGECAVSLALTQPIDIVKLPAVEGPITFSERNEPIDCQ